MLRRAAGGVVIAAVAVILAATHPVDAAGCPALDYRDGLVAAAASLRQPPGGVAAAQRELAVLLLRQPQAAAVLQPALDDLGASPPAADDARRRLESLSAALAYPPGSVCNDGDQAAARSALRQVYASPDLRHLDEGTRPGLLAAILQAVAGLIARAAGSIGPTGLAVLTMLAVVAPLLFAWRSRRRAARGHDPARIEAADRGDDPDEEWRLAEGAAAKGEYREAVRRAFRAALLEVALRGRLRLDAAWTTRELLARCDADGDVLAMLAAAAALFEHSWYSGTEVTEGDWRLARERCAAVIRLVAVGVGRG